MGFRHAGRALVPPEPARDLPSFEMTTHTTRQTASPLILELLAWVASRPRTYAEAIEAWRSNCPRLSVWDDAFTDGLVRVVRSGATASQSEVTLTALGRANLDGRSESRPRAAAMG